MKKKEFLTEAKRKAIIADKEKAIIESFAKTFNKIKRIDENEINEAATVQDKLDELVGNPISLIRTKHTSKYNPQIGDNEPVTQDEPIDGVIGKIGDFEGIKGLTVMNGQGGKIAFLMYDEKSGEFIEGDSTWKYTYKGADEQSDRILKFILRYLVGVNPINEFEELNPLYSRQQEYGINPEIDPSELSGLNTYKVEVIGKELEKDGGSKHRWVYEIEANDEEEAEAKAADKFNGPELFPINIAEFLITLITPIKSK